MLLWSTPYMSRKEQELSRAARFNREISTKQNRISGLEQERELSQSKYDLAVAKQQLFQENNNMQRYVIYSLDHRFDLNGTCHFLFLSGATNNRSLSNNLLALKSLRSQMNPHFIFNALNSVNQLYCKKR